MRPNFSPDREWFQHNLENHGLFKSVFLKNFPNNWQENALYELISTYGMVPPISFDVTIAR